MVNRYWCGECTFKTPWLAEPEGLRRQTEHYAAKHPGTPPGGQVEIRRRNLARVHRPLLLVAVLLALLAAVATCRP
ncbi:hypothetical protein [Streptomyces sp. NPDC048442]|uniref:hypothetical protein n=1 Tax=Streptomyces sp. NPDC048442 TaxID=3154823 RepID=UPI0034438D48